MGVIKKITLVILLIVISYGIFNVVSMYDSPFRPENTPNIPQNDVLSSFIEQRIPLCYEDECNETPIPMESREDPTGEIMWVETDKHYQQRIIEIVFNVLMFPLIIGISILIIYKIIKKKKKRDSIY